MPAMPHCRQLLTRYPKRWAAAPAAAKEGSAEPAMPYMDLANLVRYEGVTTNLQNPQFTKAKSLLIAEEASIAGVGLHA